MTEDAFDEQLQRILATAAHAAQPSRSPDPEAAALLLARVRRRRHRLRVGGAGLLVASALVALALVAGVLGRSPTAQRIHTLGQGGDAASATTTTSNAGTTTTAPIATASRPGETATPCPVVGCGSGPPPSTGVSTTGPLPITGPYVTITGTAAPAPTTRPTTTTTTTTTTQAGGLVVVTEAGSGSPVSLHIGQSLRVQLAGSPAFPWSGLTASDASILQAQPSGIVPSPGSAVAQYRGVAPGQATVTAYQDPTCLQSTPPCGVPSRLFTLTVNVVA